MVSDIVIFTIIFQKVKDFIPKTGRIFNSLLCSPFCKPIYQAQAEKNGSLIKY